MKLIVFEFLSFTELDSNRIRKKEVKNGTVTNLSGTGEEPVVIEDSKWVERKRRKDSLMVVLH
jgi:hypothetical protein